MSALPLVAIVGATGTGKSDLALSLAEAMTAQGLAAEIVNADAMQLYRGMDVGTAKVVGAARRGIPHHLFDVLDVTDEASVARYQLAARGAIDEIAGRGAVPILVGGSGLYVWSVAFDFRFPGRDASLRLRLEAELEARGAAELFDRLRQVDPLTAARLDPSNGRRLIRALEIRELAERDDRAEHGHGAALPIELTPWRPLLMFGLSTPRETLVARLDARVEQMWADGMLDEVELLRAKGIEHGVTARRAIGYAQALAQLRGEISEAEAIARTQQLTRRYARRQRSWFTRYGGVEWLDTEQSTATERRARSLARLDEWRSR